MGSCLPHPPLEQDDLAAGLSCCEHLLAEHIASVTRVHGNYGLGMVDLPPLERPGEIVAAQVNSAAVLYWCDQVEQAGVLAFVETLAERVFTGQFALPIHHAADKLRPFWRSAQHRFTAPERQMLYRQVLDAGVEGRLHQQLRQTAGALAAIGREPMDNAILHLQTRAAWQIHDLTRGLSDRAVGISGFAARDIVNQIRAALEALADREISQALGGGSAGFMLQRWAPSLIGYQPQFSLHLRLAQNGVELLRWFAREGEQIVANSRLIARHHPLIHNAEAWLAAAQGLRGGFR
ncbi:MAG: hypothetical protein KZQ88_03530 [Candidatus Thiodiazotropha sp. (ex Dulcina madagascariensis)]|nr:hypothetical protein [Candidatus Thiodiazotropha sp. (ex Dulcina madagascariensis)]MCU7925930.1 hypothetical protein [Candidatus Thiodiazotropha sp. (ex Dulcina madagascariensis)]